MATGEPFTIIDAGRDVPVAADARGDRVRLGPGALAALGWPAGAAEADLAETAAALDRPLALDIAERAAWVGVSARERTDALRSLRAPDFALPDLAGRLHRLSDHRGRKVFLVAYASW
jgi:hypothetical protein